MKLSNTALEHLKSNSKTRLQVALALGRTEQTINRLIRENAANSPLTTAAALVEIGRATNLDLEHLVEMQEETPQT